MRSEEVLSKTYTTPEMAKILDVSVRKVISMLERGYFAASIQEANGHPSRRLFDFWDVARAHAVLELLTLGLSVDYARSMGRLLEGDGIREPYLMIDQGKEVCPTSDDPRTADELRLGFMKTSSVFGARLVLHVPLKQMRFRLTEKIKKML